jgi:hypothetical protein
MSQSPALRRFIRQHEAKCPGVIFLCDGPVTDADQRKAVEVAGHLALELAAAGFGPRPAL